MLKVLVIFNFFSVEAWNAKEKSGYCIFLSKWGQTLHFWANNPYPLATNNLYPLANTTVIIIIIITFTLLPVSLTVKVMGVYCVHLAVRMT